MNIAERLRFLRETLGVTQEEFGKKIGRTKGAISAYEKGERKPDKTTLMLIEKVFNVNPQWLEKGYGEIFLSKYIPVEYYEDFSLSAGYGIGNEDSAKMILQVSEDFVRERLGKLRVDGLISFPILGNSMHPTIPDGSIGIFIDYKKEGFLLDGEIYAFRIDDTFYVKRIFKDPKNKKLKFVSDNDKYETFLLEESELDRLFIIGRYLGHIFLK